MRRNLTEKLRYGHLNLSILILSFFWSTILLAESAGRKSNVTTGKMAAPTVEDHADYFAPSTRHLSKDALKKADELRLKTMASIKEMLAKSKTKLNEFELMLRLGELNIERHDYLRDLEIEEFSNSYDKWLVANKKGKEPKITYARSKEELNKAANTFRMLVNKYPKHERVDSVLFVLAKTLARLENESAPLYYEQLLTRFPKSPHVPDAYLALGEYYFDRHQIEKAMQNYKMAMTYKDHRAYTYAVYKLGWAYYNYPTKNENESQENYKKAVIAFKLVVKLADQEKEKEKEGKINLKEEAIRDLIMVWAEAEDVDSAWKYFQTIGDKNSFYAMLERLGNIYADQGQNSKAVNVFARLLRERPLHPKNPEIYEKMVSIKEVIYTSEPNEVVKELKNMQTLFLGSSNWVTANQTDQDKIKSAEKMVEFNLHRYGTLFHDRGIKMKKNIYLAAAAEIYTTYLASFEKNPNAYEIRFYLAEILRDFGKYDSAASHYLIVAREKPKDGKYLKEAALSAVECMNILVNKTKYAKLPPPGQVNEPITIPKEKMKLIEMIDNYSSLLPQEKKGLAMRFTATQIYFDYGHYATAIKRAESLINSFPGSKQADSAVHLVLGYFYENEKWDSAISWSKRFQASPMLMANKKLANYINDVNRLSVFKCAASFEKVGKYEQAAVTFLAYQSRYPKDGNADRALHNASINYYKAGKVDEALDAERVLLEKYPGSALRPDVMANLAQTYESTAHFEIAAKYYEDFAKTYVSDRRAREAHFNAAVLNKGLNRLDKSIALFKEFIKRYPADSRTPDIKIELAKLLERKGEYSSAGAMYRDYAINERDRNPERTLFAEAKAAEIMIRSGNPKGPNELAKLAKNLTSSNLPAFEAREIVAAILFKSLDKGYADFMAMKIKNSQRIEKDVRQKQAKLENLARLYERVIGIKNGEYTVASLYRLGEMNKNFADTLFAAPAPTNATQAELNAYRTSLEKVAFPLKDEAGKFFEAAYEQSKGVETFTVWTKRAYQKMNEINSEKYPEMVEQSLDPEYLSHTVLFNKDVEGLLEIATESK